MYGRELVLLAICSEFYFLRIQRIKIQKVIILSEFRVRTLKKKKKKRRNFPVGYF